MWQIFLYTQLALCLAAPAAKREPCGWHVSSQGSEPLWCDDLVDTRRTNTLYTSSKVSNEAAVETITKSLGPFQSSLKGWFAEHVAEFSDDISGAPVSKTVPAKAAKCVCPCIRVGSRGSTTWAWRSSAIKDSLRRRRQSGRGCPPPQRPKKIVLGYYGQNADSSSSSSEEESETSRPPSSEGQAVGGAPSGEEANQDAPGDSDSDIQEVPIEEGSRAGLGWIPPEYPSPVSVSRVLYAIHRQTVSLGLHLSLEFIIKVYFSLRSPSALSSKNSQSVARRVDTTNGESSCVNVTMTPPAATSTWRRPPSPPLFHEHTRIGASGPRNTGRNAGNKVKGTTFPRGLTTPMTAVGVETEEAWAEYVAPFLALVSQDAEGDPPNKERALDGP